MDWLHFGKIYGPIKDIRVVKVADRAGIMIRLPRSTFPRSGSEPAHSEMTESSDVFAMYCMPDFQFLDVWGETKDLEEESIFDDIGVHRRQFFVGSLNDESADEALDDHRLWEFHNQLSPKKEADWITRLEDSRQLSKKPRLQTKAKRAPTPPGQKRTKLKEEFIQAKDDLWKHQEPIWLKSYQH